jgi:hypothetical protein
MSDGGLIFSVVETLGSTTRELTKKFEILWTLWYVLNILTLNVVFALYMGRTIQCYATVCETGSEEKIFKQFIMFINE